MQPVVPEELIPPAPVLSVEEALKTFTLADGFVIEPVAAEPMVEKPVGLRFDGDGRIWVIEMRGYMTDLDGNDEDIPQGRIAVLEDTNNDGQADKRSIFLDNILLPRAIALVKDGILIGDEHTLSFCGRDGAKRTSEPVVVDDKFAPSGNVEHKPNSLLPHLNNWLYNSKSDKRYRWQDGKLLKDTTEFRGQWGLSMDSFGRIYSTNNSTILRGDRLLPESVETIRKAKLKSETSIQLGTNQVYPVRVNPGINRAYMAVANGYATNMLDPKTHKLINTTASAGLDFYRGDQFPKSWRDVAFTTECVGNLVKATRVTANGLTLTGEHVFPDSEFLASTDERFRPVNIHTAPDGSLYLVDYYHGVIQHKIYMTSYLRAQYESRGLEAPSYELGRIYRIRHKDTPLGPQPKLLGASSPELIKALSHPNGWWRDTAQRLLVERNDASTVEPLKEITTKTSGSHQSIHSLWALAGMDQLDASTINRALRRSPEEFQAHLFTSSLKLPEGERLGVANYAITRAAAPSPYLLKLFLSLSPKDAQTLIADYKGNLFEQPFAPQMAATSLLSQGITEFPKTNFKLTRYLGNFAKNTKSLTPEQRLSGGHLASFKRGKELYSTTAACIACHGADGGGMPNLGPPLDESEWVTESPERLAKILLHGLQGPITVNGIKYKPLAAMPGLAMNPTITDKNIADIMTYLRAEWSNKAGPVKEKDVTAVREGTKDRNGRVYTADELK